MRSTFRRAGVGLVLAAALLGTPARGAGASYTIQEATAEPPKELTDAIHKLLKNQSVQLLDGTGSPVAELWFRKELPSKATPEQVKNGLTYQELEETTLIGAARFTRPWSDYRKQKIAAGVYTLRLGFQPMDGDHMGTAPHNEFLLLIPANLDPKPDRMETKELRELSTKASKTSHPAVLLLFPNAKPEDKPRLVDKGTGHLALAIKSDALAAGQKAPLGFALTLVGHTSAE
jgi:hypothetical protein